MRVCWVDLVEDSGEVDKELEELWGAATGPSRFEFKYLDNDGKTIGLEQWISRGAEIFYVADDEIKQKYKHLVPPNFVRQSLATLEFSYLTSDDGLGNMV